ncbi:S8 family peptidase [uncultured Salinibacterium sp.]|uniref:S8 family peptidase n=1 Tax=uncultured Salinibacterium sp. TaxID=459274 RepID=UPI0030DC68A6
MAPNAIAKSHRPQQRLFRPSLTPHVATAGIGEPIYAATPASLRKVLSSVLKAEIDVIGKLDTRTGEIAPNPSRYRCEVSAIDSLHLWIDENKRSFSAAEGAEWLARAGTGHRYFFELFPIATASSNPELASVETTALRSLERELSTFSVEVERLASEGTPTLSLKPLPPGSRSRVAISSQAEPAPRKNELRQSPDVALRDDVFHQRVLESLCKHPLVRRVLLPPIVQQAAGVPIPLGSRVPDQIFERTSDDTPSIVGVIDGGVGDAIGGWLEGRWGQLAPTDRDLTHGTFISGLLVAAGSLNPHLSKQPHGCRVYDVDVLPADPGETGIPFDAYYPGGIPEFLDEVEAAVSDLRSRHRVRVFNFSLNFQTPGDRAKYGYTAMRLDQIAARHDVILVISAGNLPPLLERPEWSSDTSAAIAALVADTNGTVAEPGESLFNASVSALNPPGLIDQVPFALARYSRRGPGLRGALKPDFAHIGGSGTPSGVDGSGLFSIDVNGNAVTDAGTSYAAPLVARQLADLDSLIEGDVSREVLLAMLSHHARVPELYAQRQVLPLARHLVGYGVPREAEEMLQSDDSEITLVFDSVLQPGEQATLTFAWPASLVTHGKCRGYAKLTLVARPQLAYEHGDERVRVNIGAKLMQQTKTGGFENRVHAVNTPKAPTGQPRAERDLINESLKWQTTKSYEARLTGRGPSSTWKFAVNYLTRADEAMPAQGVEFAAVLTISDPAGSAPVFRQMRQQLSQLGIRTDDIRTSLRARARA